MKVVGALEELADEDSDGMMQILGAIEYTVVVMVGEYIEFGGNGNCDSGKLETRSACRTRQAHQPEKSPFRCSPCC